MNLEVLRFEGKVHKTMGEDAFICTSIKEADGYYRYGTIKFAGFETEIIDHTKGKLTLSTTPAQPIKPGDKFTLYPGCNKDFSTCHHKFQNALNFRGEPFIPKVGRFLF